MSRFGVLFLLLLPLAVPSMDAAVPQDPAGKKDAWEWTDAERLDGLLDNRATASRLEAFRNENPSGGDSAVAGDAKFTVVDVIDGRRDPQLFFPFEVFEHAVEMAYSTNSGVRRSYRESKDDARRLLRLPDDMWDRMEAIVATYRAARLANTDRARGKTKGTTSVDPTTAVLCRERHLALEEAQRTFGPQFTRFLYTAVAPDVHRRYLQRPNSSMLKIAAGDCE